jgi:hypothetical protein
MLYLLAALSTHKLLEFLWVRIMLLYQLTCFCIHSNERGNKAHGRCDRSTGDAYSSIAPDHTSDIFRGLCMPILWFVFAIRLMRLITDRYFCHFKAEFIFKSYRTRRNHMLWLSVRYFNISTFYLLTLINAIHMSIPYTSITPMIWK